jgi:enolase
LIVSCFTLARARALADAEALRGGAHPQCLGIHERVVQHQVSIFDALQRANGPHTTFTALFKRTSFGILIEAVEIAGYRPGKDIAISLDIAASELFQTGSII